MITRIWHGRTKAKDAQSYLKFLLCEGTKDYRDIDENISINVWQKLEGDVCHFFTVTEWPDINAVKKFAGEDFQKARYYPQDKGILLEFEETVEHYNSYRVSNTGIKHFIKQFRQLFEGGSWQGESFVKKLEQIKEKDAFKQPASGANCIAELIWHCLYWRAVLINRLSGIDFKTNVTSNQMDFLPRTELKELGWPLLWQLFQKSQDDIVNSLSVKTDDFLSTEYQPGHTMEFLLEGIIQHDIYHLGQIGLIIRLNETNSKL